MRGALAAHVPALLDQIPQRFEDQVGAPLSATDRGRVHVAGVALRLRCDMAEQRREPPMGTDTTVAEKPGSSGATATLTDAPRTNPGVDPRAARELASIDPTRYELGDELARGGM